MAGFSFGAGVIKQRGALTVYTRRGVGRGVDGLRNGFDAPEMMSARQGSGFSSKSARDRFMIGSDGEASQSFLRNYSPS
ncbi:hypothetical protein GCM10007880_67370 [Mesorhizobium amorphae]|nr:hypothetical protein GCM10007880_67370 [Mesorhizobium amorphae]